MSPRLKAFVIGFRGAARLVASRLLLRFKILLILVRNLVFRPANVIRLKSALNVFSGLAFITLTTLLVRAILVARLRINLVIVRSVNGLRLTLVDKGTRTAFKKGTFAVIGNLSLRWVILLSRDRALSKSETPDAVAMFNSGIVMETRFAPKLMALSSGFRTDDFRLKGTWVELLKGMLRSKGLKGAARLTPRLFLVILTRLSRGLKMSLAVKSNVLPVNLVAVLTVARALSIKSSVRVVMLKLLTRRALLLPARSLPRKLPVRAVALAALVVKVVSRARAVGVLKSFRNSGPLFSVRLVLNILVSTIIRLERLFRPVRSPAILLV